MKVQIKAMCNHKQLSTEIVIEGFCRVSVGQWKKDAAQFKTQKAKQ